MELSRQAARRGYFLLKKVNAAIRKFQMIRDGDRVAVAVSGGKDSLSLLTLLRMRRQRVPQPFEMVAVHVRGDARGLDCPPHPPLARWLEVHSYDHVVEPMDLDPGEPLPMSCFRCSWNRRKTIFRTAGRLGCNVVAYAHQADDFAQTTLMNLFYGGRLETMAPVADYFGGRFRLIRPLVFVPEKEVARFARACDYVPPPPPCPRADDSHRERMARILRLFQRDADKVRKNLVRTPLRHMGFADAEIDGS